MTTLHSYDQGFAPGQRIEYQPPLSLLEVAVEGLSHSSPLDIGYMALGVVVFVAIAKLARRSGKSELWLTAGALAAWPLGSAIVWLLLGWEDFFRALRDHVAMFIAAVTWAIYRIRRQETGEDSSGRALNQLWVVAVPLSGLVLFLNPTALNNVGSVWPVVLGAGQLFTIALLWSVSSGVHRAETIEPLDTRPQAGVVTDAGESSRVTASEQGMSNGKRMLKVFLCHSSSDKKVVTDLHSRLMKEGFEPWLDSENLKGGQDWEFEIRNAVRRCDVVLVCLSRASITKEGFVHKEIRLAVDVADEKPEGIIYIIPLRLEECSVPTRLAQWHRIDLYSANGYGELLKALRHRLGEVGGSDRSETL